MPNTIEHQSLLLILVTPRNIMLFGSSLCFSLTLYLPTKIHYRPASLNTDLHCVNVPSSGHRPALQLTGPRLDTYR